MAILLGSCEPKVRLRQDSVILWKGYCMTVYEQNQVDEERYEMQIKNYEMVMERN